MLVWTWPNPPTEIISYLTSIFIYDNYMDAFFLPLSSRYENHKRVHVAFFIFHSSKLKFNQL